MKSELPYSGVTTTAPTKVPYEFYRTIDRKSNPSTMGLGITIPAKLHTNTKTVCFQLITKHIKQKEQPHVTLSKGDYPFWIDGLDSNKSSVS